MCAQKDMVIVSLIAFDFFRVKLTSDFFFLIIFRGICPFVNTCFFGMNIYA